MPSNSAKNAPFDKRIPKQYRGRKTTDLKVEIKEGENPHEFKMTRLIAGQVSVRLLRFHLPQPKPTPRKIAGHLYTKNGKPSKPK